MERAARLSGSRFGYLVGDTALLALAVYRYALDVTGSEGFVPVLPPVLVREEAMYGTGFFPTDRSNIYAIESDDLYLTGTSEVALAGLHMGEILEGLPLRYSAFSTCFRREPAVEHLGRALARELAPELVRVGAGCSGIDHARESKYLSITCATPSSSTGGQMRFARARTWSCAFATATA